MAHCKLVRDVLEVGKFVNRSLLTWSCDITMGCLGGIISSIEHGGVGFSLRRVILSCGRSSGPAQLICRSKRQLASSHNFRARRCQATLLNKVDMIVSCSSKLSHEGDKKRKRPKGQ